MIRSVGTKILHTVRSKTVMLPKMYFIKKENHKPFSNRMNSPVSSVSCVSSAKNTFTVNINAAVALTALLNLNIHLKHEY